MAAEGRVFHTLKSSANCDIVDIPRLLGLAEVLGGIPDRAPRLLWGVILPGYFLFSLNANP